MRHLFIFLSLIGITISYSNVGQSQEPPALVDPWVPDVDVPDPPTTQELTLDQALAYADRFSPWVLAVQADARVSEADMIEANARLPENPVVSFGGGQRVRHGTRGFEFELGLEQQVAIAGQRGKQRQVARAREIVAQARVHEMRWRVHVEIHRLVADLVLVQERIAQAKQFVQFTESMRDIAARQVHEGESAPLVLLVANADLAQSKEALLEAENAAYVFQLRLAAVMGWPMQTLPPIQATLPAIQTIESPDTLVQMMVEKHPEIRMHQWQVRAEELARQAAARAVWPDPTIGASLTKENGLDNEHDAYIWMLHLQVPIPLWKRQQGEKARAEAQSLRAALDKEQSERRLTRELMSAIATLNSAAARVALYEETIVPHLQENLHLLHRAYELGEVGIHELSQTRERLLHATGQYIDARMAYYEAAAVLEGLVGTELWITQKETP